MSAKLVSAYRTLGLPVPDGVSTDVSLEYELPMLSKREAALEIARHHAKRIVAGSVRPYDGVKAIVWEAHHQIDLQELIVFAGLESEFADFSDETRQEFYGTEHCEKVRSGVEDRICDAARNFIADDA